MASQDETRFEKTTIAPENTSSAGDLSTFATWPLRDASGDWGFANLDADYYMRTPSAEEEAENITAVDRAIGAFARLNPAPVMHDAFRSLDQSFLSWLSKAESNESTHCLYIQGDPGFGKTFINNMFSQAFGFVPGRNYIEIGSGAGGGDLDQLAVEATIGGKAVSSIADKLNFLIRSEAPEDQPLIGIVRAALEKGNLLSEDRNEVSFAKVLKVAEASKEYKKTESDEAKNTFLLDALNTSREALGKIAQTAGVIEEGASLSIGLQERNGKLLDALLKAKETGEPTLILLDEFNRYKEMGKKFQSFFEMLGGKMHAGQTVTIEGRDPETHLPKNYEFSYDDLQHVMVVMTGNDPQKEPEAFELSQSLQSRIQQIKLGEFSAPDWQCRFEQKLTGLPINNHMLADPDISANDPVRFGQMLLAQRMRGLTAAHQSMIPKGENERLQQWQNIHEAAGNLGQFMESWKTICSDKTKRRSLGITPDQERALGADDLYFDARLLDDIVNAARTPKRSVSKGLDALMQRRKKPVETATSTNFGDALVDAISNEVDQRYADRSPAMQCAVYSLMLQHKVISKEQFARKGFTEEEITTVNNALGIEVDTGSNEQRRIAKDGEIRTVAELVNVQRVNGLENYLPIQEAMCAILRQRYSDTIDTALPDEDLIRIIDVQSAVEDLTKREAEMLQNGRDEALPPYLTHLPLLQFTEREQGGFVPTIETMTAVDRYRVFNEISEQLAPITKRQNAISKRHKKAPEEQATLKEEWDKLTEQRNSIIEEHKPYQSVYQTENAVSNLQLLTSLALSSNPAAVVSQMRGKELSTGRSEVADSLNGQTAGDLSITVIKVRSDDPTLKHIGSNDSFAEGNDTLKVISVKNMSNDENAPSHRMLIVGHSDVPESMQKMLADKGITYIQASRAASNGSIEEEIAAIDKETTSRIEYAVKELVELSVNHAAGPEGISFAEEYEAGKETLANLHQALTRRSEVLASYIKSDARSKNDLGITAERLALALQSTRIGTEHVQNADGVNSEKTFKVDLTTLDHDGVLATLEKQKA